MKGPIDFDAINKAALAAFPAVLARILPSGKRIGAEIVALNPRRADRRLGSFKINATTAGGRTSRPATKAGIQSRLSPISPTSRRARQRGCSRKCSGSKPARRAMADGLDFSPCPMTNGKRWRKRGVRWRARRR